MRYFIYTIAGLLIGLFLTFMWLLGIAISTGWGVVLACLLIPYAWYVVVDHFARLWGWI